MYTLGIFETEKQGRWGKTGDILFLYMGQMQMPINDNKMQTPTLRPKYEIEIDQSAGYPFNGPKPELFINTVKLVLPFHPEGTHGNIHKLLQIQSQALVQIYKITESQLHKRFVFVYEYVPYHLNYPSLQFQQNLKSGKYKPILTDLFTKMIQLGIKPDLHPQNFGFDDQFQLRFFVRPHFEQSTIEEPVDMIVENLLGECDRIFQNIDNGVRFKIKVSHLSQKIKKIQNDILIKQPNRREKKSSESAINSSECSDSQAKTGGEVEKIGNSHWQIDHDFNFDSMSLQCNRNKKKQRSLSFRENDKPKIQARLKKTSWEGDWKEDKMSNGAESDKMTVLKKRISEALFKTQKTLTKYQRIRSKTKNRKQ